MFELFLNSKQWQNRLKKTEQKKIKGVELTWPYLVAHQQPSPLEPAQPTSALPVVFLLGTVGQRRVAGARAHAPEPPPACRPAPDRLRMPRTPSGLSQLPPVLIPSSCSPSRSAPRTRTEPSPPTPFAAATIPLSPPRRLPELRSASLDLLDVSRDQKGPEQPPSTSSPSFGPGAVLRRIRPLRRAPELADPPCTIPVSPCSVSP